VARLESGGGLAFGGLGGGDEWQSAEFVDGEFGEPDGTIRSLGDAMHDGVLGGHFVVGDRNVGQVTGCRGKEVAVEFDDGVGAGWIRVALVDVDLRP
jgi:hypothetical protein